jgi:hypothetical protein
MANCKLQRGEVVSVSEEVFWIVVLILVLAFALVVASPAVLMWN